MTLNDLFAWLSDDYRQKLEAKKRLQEERKKSLLEFYSGNYVGPGSDSDPYPLHEQLLDARPRLREMLNKPSIPVNQWELERYGVPKGMFPPKGLVKKEPTI